MLREAETETKKSLLEQRNWNLYNIPLLCSIHPSHIIPPLLSALLIPSYMESSWCRLADLRVSNFHYLPRSQKGEANGLSQVYYSIRRFHTCSIGRAGKTLAARQGVDVFPGCHATSIF
jgi:hypothetical protein